MALQLPTKKQAADEIERGMIEEGVGVFVIEVAFAKAQSFFLSIFNLLKAFLALGLAVGIAGLAVVTIRNVSERQHQIGILRALGFHRSMVVWTFWWNCLGFPSWVFSMVHWLGSDSIMRCMIVSSRKMVRHSSCLGLKSH